LKAFGKHLALLALLAVPADEAPPAAPPFRVQIEVAIHSKDANDFWLQEVGSIASTVKASLVSELRSRFRYWTFEGTGSEQPTWLVRFIALETAPGRIELRVCFCDPMEAAATRPDAEPTVTAVWREPGTTNLEAFPPVTNGATALLDAIVKHLLTVNKGPVQAALEKRVPLASAGDWIAGASPEVVLLRLPLSKAEYGSLRNSFFRVRARDDQDRVIMINAHAFGEFRLHPAAVASDPPYEALVVRPDTIESDGATRPLDLTLDDARKFTLTRVNLLKEQEPTDFEITPPPPSQ
jgi:hypothetical protein